MQTIRRLVPAILASYSLSVMQIPLAHAATVPTPSLSSTTFLASSTEEQKDYDCGGLLEGTFINLDDQEEIDTYNMKTEKRMVRAFTAPQATRSALAILLLRAQENKDPTSSIKGPLP